jgi:hypothetical protein
MFTWILIVFLYPFSLVLIKMHKNYSSNQTRIFCNTCKCYNSLRNELSRRSSVCWISMYCILFSLFTSSVWKSDCALFPWFDIWGEVKKITSGPDVVDHACHFCCLAGRIMVRGQASPRVSMLWISTNKWGMMVHVYNLNYVGDIGQRLGVWNKTWTKT